MPENIMNTLRQLLSAFALLTIALVPLRSMASPPYVNYQGLLNGANGQPLPTGNYKMEFNIYDKQSGGNKIWGPFQFDGDAADGHGAVVPVVNGRFNVIIGPQDTAKRNLLDAFGGGSDRFVEIKVADGEPILPRQQFLTTPYAATAANAAKLGAAGSSVAATVSGNSVEVKGTYGTTPLLKLNQDLGGWGTKELFNNFRYISTAFPGVPADGPFRQFNVGGGGVSIGYPNVPTYDSPDALYVSGNVGIGTSTPAHALDVKGNISLSGTHLLFNSGVGVVDWTGDLLFRTLPTQGDINKFQDRMVIKRDGKVGIGTSTPEDSLHVDGVLRGTGFRCRAGINGGGYQNVFNVNWSGGAVEVYIDERFVGVIQMVSDRRLKENIEPLKLSGLDRIKALKPVSFQYKTIPDSIFVGGPNVHEGFIADELQAVIPSAVTGTKDGLTKDGKIQPQTINSTPIISVLTKAVQELAQKVGTQDSELTSLREEVAQLRREKNTFAATVEAMQARFTQLEQAMNNGVTPTTPKDLRSSAR